MSQPSWLSELFDPTPFLCSDGMLRSQKLASTDQEQTSNSFDYKWKRRETFDSEASRARMRAWLIERYGDVAGAGWWADYGERPLVVDAGCGAGLSALELFGKRLAEVRFLGVDISEAVDVAATRFAERGIEAAFMQADLTELPLAEGSVDVIFSEGVLHHTDSTEGALRALAPLLRTGGRFLFYVYRKKGPIREFCDDYIRDRLGDMEPQAAWDAVMPLTRLGALLGDLEIELDIPEAIDLLEIPAGKINLQRLFYWHVFKAFHHPDLSIDEMNHINFDWYAPANAHRQTAEQLRSWCDEAGLDVEREIVQEAGITIIARKR